MSVRDKQNGRLAALELELRTLLDRELSRSAETGAIAAFVTEDADPLMQRWAARQGLELLHLVEEIEQLQIERGEPVGWICVRYRAFCRTLFDHEDPHRLGPKRLAQRFLEELRVRWGSDP